MFSSREPESTESRRTEFEHMLTTANSSLTHCNLGQDTFGSEEGPSEYSLDEQCRHWTSLKNWAESELQKLNN